MQRLSEIDLPALAPGVPAWVIDIVTAIFCFGLMVIVRVTLQTFVPGAAPFALLYPFGLIATLLSSWRAGVLTFYVGLLGAWYLVLPPEGFAVETSTDAARLVINACSGAATLAIAQMFRDSAHRAAHERVGKLEERELLLRELNHRVTNNFAMVASLLQMQATRATDDGVKAALGNAINRVMSISQAHRNLYAAEKAVGEVDMSAYLDELCRNLAEALFLGDIVALECRAVSASMDRDRAVAIGLVVNELVTNAAKHAFTDGSGGTIRVAFQPHGQGWRLTVADDGQGLPSDFTRRRGGLGRGLVEAFARQAGGTLSIAEGPGAVFVLDLKS
ncbi:MAG TPA: sensor histidine kinase [Caulobacteraceae bacterium]